MSRFRPLRASGEFTVLGIYEGTFRSSEGLIGAYTILAVVALMVLRAVPGFFREVRNIPPSLGSARAVRALAAF